MSSTLTSRNYAEIADDRDVGFELFTGSCFRRAGLTPLFNPAGDITLPGVGGNIFIECKRPKKEAKLERNIAKAFSQLQVRYRSDENARGIIALSITKLLNPDALLLVVDTQEQLSTKMANVVEGFIRANESLWQRRKDGRTLGVLVSFQALIGATRRKQVATEGEPDPGSTDFLVSDVIF